MSGLLLAALLALPVSSRVNPPAQDCKTVQELEASLARDFPAGGSPSASVERTKYPSKHTFAVPGVPEDVTKTFPEALKRLGLLPGADIRTVIFAYGSPQGHTIFSFIEVRAGTCFQDIDRMRVIKKSDGTFQTMLPHFPR